MIEFAYSTNAFKKFELNKAIAIVSEIGFSGVELLCDIPHAYPKNLNHHGIQNIRNLIENLNLKISNLNTFTLFALGDTYHPSWIEENSFLRQKRIEHTIDCIKMAKALGAKNISVEPGGPKNGYLNQNELLKIFLDGIKNVLPIAEKEDVNILVEPEPKLLIENTFEFLNFIKHFESEYLKLNCDIGHFYCVEEDPSDVIYKLADYIGHFHIEDISKDRIHEHLILGEGSIDFHSVFKSIREIGYNGFITLELYPYQDCPEEAGRKSLKYVNEKLKDYL